MFEKFHKRVEPKDLAGIGVAGAGVTPSQSTQTLTHSVTRKKSKARSSAVDKSLRLNAEQKCDIAQREIEELREEIDHLKDDSEKVLDTYKVSSGSEVMTTFHEHKIPVAHKNSSQNNFWSKPPRPVIISPANCVCGRVYCFHVVRLSERTNKRATESVSSTFCFLNILKSH